MATLPVLMIWKQKTRNFGQNSFYYHMRYILNQTTTIMMNNVNLSAH